MRTKKLYTTKIYENKKKANTFKALIASPTLSNCTIKNGERVCSKLHSNKKCIRGGMLWS